MTVPTAPDGAAEAAFGRLAEMIPPREIEVLDFETSVDSPSPEETTVYDVLSTAPTFCSTS
jgi:hypothetical protein